jgi:hypothetical protein
VHESLEAWPFFLESEFTKIKLYLSDEASLDR